VVALRLDGLQGLELEALDPLRDDELALGAEAVLEAVHPRLRDAVGGLAGAAGDAEAEDAEELRLALGERVVQAGGLAALGGGVGGAGEEEGEADGDGDGEAEHACDQISARGPRARPRAASPRSGASR